MVFDPTTVPTTSAANDRTRGGFPYKAEVAAHAASVANALAHNRLQVFGWYYDILTGHIEQYNEPNRRFEPLTEND